MIDDDLAKARALLAQCSPEDLSDLGRGKHEAAAARTAAEDRRHSEGFQAEQNRQLRRIGESVEAEWREREERIAAEAEARAAAEAAERQAMVTLVHRDGWVREFSPATADRILEQMPSVWFAKGVLKSEETPFDDAGSPAPLQAEVNLDQRRRHDALRRRALRRGAA